MEVKKNFWMKNDTQFRQTLGIVRNNAQYGEREQMGK
jgi:hypothetical protein